MSTGSVPAVGQQVTWLVGTPVAYQQVYQQQPQRGWWLCVVVEHTKQRWGLYDSDRIRAGTAVAVRFLGPDKPLHVPVSCADVSKVRTGPEVVAWYTAYLMGAAGTFMREAQLETLRRTALRMVGP